MLKMIMSPFWREVKWREYGGMEAFTGTGRPALEPAPGLRNPELEKIRLVQNCMLMMKMVRKQATLFIKRRTV